MLCLWSEIPIGRRCNRSSQQSVHWETESCKTRAIERRFGDSAYAIERKFRDPSPVKRRKEARAQLDKYKRCPRACGKKAQVVVESRIEFRPRPP
mmetsp:Transcript_54908/g.87150  ORF Transcript_54908/g.87150 Transcript_54908/m.87150 type:complete len:95 (-) Transcript_54908:52-336(-)